MAAPDPYRTLGVLPSADDGVVRAAYLALMKRYHPDQNRSTEAAERAREVATAYALLSSPERRAEFDRQRPIVAARPLPPGAAAHPPVRGRAGGILLVALSAGLVGFAMTRPTLPVPRHHPPAVPEVMEAPVATVAPRPSPPLSPPSESPPVERPTPPATHVVALPLAPALPAIRKPAAQPASERTPLAPAAPAGDPCQVEASCPAIDLAALDRHLALLTGQSLQNADPETRSLLLGSQTAFRSRLARCASAICKRDAYLAHNREIAVIMRG